MACVSYLAALVLMIAVVGLLVWKARRDVASSEPRLPKPFPWDVSPTLARTFKWSAAAWRAVAWGATVSFAVIGCIVLAVGEERGITRFIVGIAIASTVLAAIGEIYFLLCRSTSGRHPAATAGLGLAWLILPPVVLTSTFVALRHDAPKMSPAGPTYHVTVVTRSGMSETTTEYDESPNQGPVFVAVGVVIYSLCLSIGWMGAGVIPVLYAAGGGATTREL